MPHELHASLCVGIYLTDRANWRRRSPSPLALGLNCWRGSRRTSRRRRSRSTRRTGACRQAMAWGGASAGVRLPVHPPQPPVAEEV